MPPTVAYAIFVVFGGLVVVPDPTMALSIPVSGIGLVAVGYARIDGSLPELGWGIAALYAFGIAASIGIWAVRSRLAESGLYGAAVLAVATLSIAALLGPYLIARGRENVRGVTFTSRNR
ncbi:hypothetical protein [Natrinema versiforme]|uniref:hypothetical protein n=1 Tax=Natrinema versiforme TaxID=88724 RepID=UPI001267AB9A|nr:hypothetical protein [Natrinema versiforme]